MAEKKIKKKTSVKRFGARYGRRIKDKLAKVEKERKGKHVCIFCEKPTVKRLSAGIWFCKKCNTKFASGAYKVNKKLSLKSMKELIEQKEAETKNE